MERDKTTDILSAVPTNDNIYFVANHSTGKIIGCTNPKYQGRSLQKIGINHSIITENAAAHFRTDLNKTAHLAAFQICGNYEIGVCQPTKDMYTGSLLACLIVFFYLLIASAALISVVSIMAGEERKKEKIYQEQLETALNQANVASEAKSVFLSNMSHDIRTPMNAIIGFTALLEKHANNEEKRNDYIAKIKSSSTYLLWLINNVLEMARIESGKTAIAETVWGITQLEDSLASVFREELQKKHLRFEKSIHVEHTYIWCDPIRLQEIYFNLIGNAIKYTPDGGTVTMTITELPSDKDGFVLYKTVISDTGIGISAEFLPHIFEDFTREKNTTQSKIGGTGLGMPITKKLVELMGELSKRRAHPARGQVLPY